MFLKAPAPLASALVLFSSMALASPPSAMDRFTANKEFCAYMVSPPDGETETLLIRYEAALEAVLNFLRQNNPQLSRSQALFALRARCDAALSHAGGP